MANEPDPFIRSQLFKYRIIFHSDFHKSMHILTKTNKNWNLIRISSAHIYWKSSSKCLPKFMLLRLKIKTVQTKNNNESF